MGLVWRSKGPWCILRTMPQLDRSHPWPRRWPLWVGVGLLLRLLFVWFPRPIDDDTVDYLQLGHNLLHYGIYGMGGGGVSPSLFRLPGYPLLLATFEQIFARFWPASWMKAVFVFQAVADVAGGLLLACFVRRHLSRSVSGRTGEIALALAMLCPFTAAFVGIGLAECLSVFAIALGVYAMGLALAAESSGRHNVPALVCAGCAAVLAMLLRPDGVLLFVALGGGSFWYTLRSRTIENSGRTAQDRRLALSRALGASSIYCFVALLPLTAWTVRNWAQFRVFQPLAPRYLNDPGERFNAGFYRWLRTWSVEYVTTSNVFWKVGSENIQLADLPPRAFDSLEQRQQTIRLIAEYNLHSTISPQLDSSFAALAAERIRTHPLRYYLLIPLLRVADMVLRPRTFEFNLDAFWWRWSEHPGQTSWAILLGLINLFYVGVASWTFLRGRVPWAWMLGGYVLLRCLLLATMENPEPRYTLECFPIFIVAAAMAFTSRSSVEAG